jgi:hypothetical protein
MFLIRAQHWSAPVWGGLFDSGILTGCGYLEKFERITRVQYCKHSDVRAWGGSGGQVRWLTWVYGPVIYQKLTWIYSGFSTMFWKLGPQGLWQIQSLGLRNFRAKNTFKSCEKSKATFKSNKKTPLNVVMDVLWLNVPFESPRHCQMVNQNEFFLSLWWV